MFSQNKKNGLPKDFSHSVTILTEGCEFTGKLLCRGASRIGGKVYGEIISEGLLIVESQAFIKGSIKAEEIIIQGKVEGEIFSRSKIELATSGTIQGEVTTPIFVIQEGAHFTGSCHMEMDESITQSTELEFSEPNAADSRSITGGLQSVESPSNEQQPILS